MRLRLPLLLAIALFAGPISATVAVFDNAPTIRMDGSVNDIQAADFDHDLKLDFAVVTAPDDKTLRLSVYLGNGDGSFRDPIVNSFTYPVVSAPRLEVADLDGNGLPDAVVSSYGATAVYPLLGKGNGSFDAMAAVQRPIPCSAHGFVLADMTNDGRVDIVTCGISVFPSLGGGNFGSPITTAAPLVGIIGVLDADGDGNLDVFSGSWGRSTFLRGHGDGTLQLDASFPETSTETFAAADFDGNGRDDLTFIDERSNDRLLMLASAAGKYPETTSMGSIAPLRGADMITPDLNGDSRPDLVAGLGSHVYVWLTRPDGSSFAATTYLPGINARNVLAGDFDADHKIDLLVHGQGETSAYDSTYVTLLRGIGDGVLHAERGYALSNHLVGAEYEPSFVAGMTLSDITGDGLLDVIVCTDWNIVVLPGQAGGLFGAPITTATPAAQSTQTASFGDLNEDGAIDVVIDPRGPAYELWLGSRAGTFRSVPGIPRTESTQSKIGDFNGDGHLDFATVTVLQAQLYPGRGDGTFGTKIVTPLSLRDNVIVRMQVADINGDGLDDILTHTTFLLGLATGGFEPRVYSQSDTDPVVADLDDDGQLDLVLFDRNSSTGRVRIGPGRGHGTFDYTRFLSLWLWQPPYAPPLAADFDGDGDVDISFSTSVLLGDGHGWFDGYARFRLPMTKGTALAADLDHNGSADLILAGAVLHGDDGEASHSIDVIRTRTTTSREIPISFAFSLQTQISPALGNLFGAAYREDSATTFRPAGGGLLFYFDDKLTAIGEMSGRYGANGNLEALRVGAHSFSAVYGGDELYAKTSAFPGGTLDVKRVTVPLIAQLNPSAPRADELLHVSGETGRAVFDVPPQGNVNVLVDNVLTATGTAPFFDIVVGPLAPGHHTVVAQYPGDASYLFASKGFNIDVTLGKVKMQLSVSPPGAAATATPVTLTASFPNDPTLTGNVEFFAGSQSLGQKPISGGTASMTTTLPMGNHTLRATFAGNGQYIETSESIPYTITPGPPRRRASGKP